MKKKILFVCLGNICRSPAAEAVFIQLIKRKGLEEKYLVDSAGTGAWHVGHLADERMRNAAQQRGIIITSLARQIQLEDLNTFDLILTMDNENLVVINSLAKEAGLDCPEKIKPILSYARGTKLIEVPDPYYGGEKGFTTVLDLLEDACEGLLEALILQG